MVHLASDPAFACPIEPRASSRSAEQVVIFDVLSHGSMHLQFNEAYVRLVRAAFPSHPIVFHARPAHLEGLWGRIGDVDRVEMRPCAPFAVPFGFSHHSPLAGRWAARNSVRGIRRLLTDCSPLFVSVLGVDANLYADFRRSWRSVDDIPLHLILHSQLGDSMLWRSRNPFVRIFDFASVIDRPLPPPVRLVALELGVQQAITEFTRKPVDGICTLEHPILRSEWCSNQSFRRDGVLRIGFLGHSSRTKGFPLFAELARKHRSQERRFEAVGMWAPDTEIANLSSLDRVPVQGGLPRTAYLEALATVDAVCLPLSGRAYDFIASGSVSDAIAGLKPLIALRTRTLEAIWDRYGPIGYLAQSSQELDEYVGTMTLSKFLHDQKTWRGNLQKLRYSRLPESQAENYAKLIGAGAISC
jgi:hypothetical protein